MAHVIDGDEQDSPKMEDPCEHCGGQTWEITSPFGIDRWFSCTTDGCSVARFQPGGAIEAGPGQDSDESDDGLREQVQRAWQWLRNRVRNVWTQQDDPQVVADGGVNKVGSAPDREVDPDRSVTCALCGELADERRTANLYERDGMPDGEAHQECVEHHEAESHVVRSPYRPLTRDARAALRECGVVGWLPPLDGKRNNGALVRTRPDDDVLEEHELIVKEGPDEVWEDEHGVRVEIYHEKGKVTVGGVEEPADAGGAREACREQDRFTRVDTDADG